MLITFVTLHGVLSTLGDNRVTYIYGENGAFLTSDRNNSFLPAEALVLSSIPMAGICMKINNILSDLSMAMGTSNCGIH